MSELLLGTFYDPQGLTLNLPILLLGLGAFPGKLADEPVHDGLLDGNGNQLCLGHRAAPVQARMFVMP